MGLAMTPANSRRQFLAATRPIPALELLAFHVLDVAGYKSAIASATVSWVVIGIP